ncbi:thioesterase family protein [Parvularcula lutaonensis]|uniref:Thioesterase family protein n=1 Tax=Parvularcula lutaonensis TaxID=491923 RepID=A0ABV7M823_9PROT|nr:thioesterase family protein [Parvularcula lutaonensis]GGY43421.1 acyl-CoA thioesterase [Parvularcula lutaonensis]
MIFSDLLKGKAAEGDLMVEIPESWAQGRTAYGGLTAAIGLVAARRGTSDLPPLRSVQVAFIGPAAGSVTATSRVLRQGKSTTFVEFDVTAEKGIASRGSLVYGSGRESAVSLTDMPMPEVPGPEGLERMEITPFHPKFLSNFEIAPAAGGLPFMGTNEHHMTWWARHRDEAARGTEEGLVAIGDLTPPAAAPLMKTFAPVSSVNWHIDILSEDLSSQDGWYLIHSHANSAGDGWSAQDMGVWARDGRPLAAARQTIVVFS